MTNVQSNRLNMYNAVSTYMKDNQEVVDTIPVFKTLQTEFQAKVNEIVELEAGRDSISAGTVLDKHKERGELLDSLLKMMSGLAVYASISGRNDILVETNVSNHEIKNDLRENELVEKSYAIFNIADSLRTELADFGIGEADVDALKSEADDYAAAIGIVVSSGASSKVATSLLSDKFSEAYSILKNKIDKLAFMLKTSYPSFYNGYKNARQIIDY